MTLDTSLLPLSGPAPKLFMHGMRIRNAEFSTGMVTFTTPMHKPETVDIYIDTDGVMSNSVQFTYTSEEVAFAYDKLVDGKYVVIEYCYGYIFAAQYINRELSGDITQFYVTDNYKLEKVR